MKKSLFKLLLAVYIVVVTGLFLYSFTQIDLNLTLSTVSLWQAIQKRFMYIGYFNRPLSTGIYIMLISFLFILYLYTLFQAYKKALNIHQIWIIIGVICVILFFSYPAFSHDIFNYMFDARTVVKYHVNPYKVKPLDFSNDPWLNFMRWTHRSSIYPPLWIGITLPLYLLGFNKLIPIILNFKAIILVSYLSIAFLIGRSMEKTNIRHKTTAVVFFALNPLVLIEGLVSAHNDMFMMMLAILAFYYLKKQTSTLFRKFTDSTQSRTEIFIANKIPLLKILCQSQYCSRISTAIRKFLVLGTRIVGFLILSFSVAIKWVTVSLLPLILIGPRRFFSFLFMLLGLIIVISNVEIQPWYFLWILPFAALNIDRKWIVIPSIGFSLGLLLRYVPFLYLGNWDQPVPTIKFWVTIIPPIFSIIISFHLQYVYKKASNK